MVLPRALPGAFWAQHPRQRQQQGKPSSGSPVKLKFWSSFIVAVFVFSLSLAAFAAPNSSETRSVDATQLVAWLIAGVPSSRLVRLVQERGVTSLPTKEQVRQLESAGADANLMRTLTGAKPPSTTASAGPIPLALLAAAAEARAQHYHAAELRLRDAVHSDPQNAALHFALGAMLRLQDQWDDAFDEVAESARLMPDLPENHGAFAYIFYRLDDGPNAIAEARTALSMDPQSAEAYQFLGLGLYSNGQYRAAVHAFTEALARDAHNADTYYDMGIALNAAEDLPGALAAYRKAIQLRPAFWEAHSNLAFVLHKEGKLAEAVNEYREAKRIAPQEPSIRNNLGNTYCDQSKFDEAVAELNELYRQHPEWELGHSCLASAYMAKKNYDSAVGELQLALRQNPTGATEHRVLGQALLLDDKPEEALREFRLAVSLNPESDVSHHYLGTALFQQKQVQAAEKEFREALRLNPSADNHFSLAACLMSMDRYEEALSEVELASRMDPSRPLYRARREELLKLMKDTNAR
jgi:tetratricopeptide (TPR) repeat protein